MICCRRHYVMEIARAVCGIAVAMFLFCIAMLVFPAKVTGCQPLPMLAGLIRPALASVAAVVTFLLAIRASSTGVISTLTSLELGLFVYALCMVLIDHKDLREDWNTIRRIMSPRRFA